MAFQKDVRENSRLASTRIKTLIAFAHIKLKSIEINRILLADPRSPLRLFKKPHHILQQYFHKSAYKNQRRVSQTRLCPRTSRLKKKAKELREINFYARVQSFLAHGGPLRRLCLFRARLCRMYIYFLEKRSKKKTRPMSISTGRASRD